MRASNGIGAVTPMKSDTPTKFEWKSMSLDMKIAIVRSMLMAGQRQYDIANKLGISQPTLSKFIRKYRIKILTGNVNSKTHAVATGGNELSKPYVSNKDDNHPVYEHCRHACTFVAQLLKRNPELRVQVAPDGKGIEFVKYGVIRTIRAETQEE